MTVLRGVIALCILFSAFSCGTKKEKAEGQRLAKVYDTWLTTADIDPSIYSGTYTKDDSSQITQLYIDSWVRQQLVLQEARQYEPSDEVNRKIERLVEEYRNSLIQQQYENALVRERIDTVVSTAELKAYYEANKAQYILDEPIVRCYFIKVPNSFPKLAEFRNAWNHKGEPDYDALLMVSTRYKDNATFFLDENQWLKINYLSQKLPPAVISAMSNGQQNIVMSDSAATWFVYTFEIVSAGRPAPLSYVSKDIADILLYGKKNELLEKVSRDLLEEAKRKGRIEILVD